MITIENLTEEELAELECMQLDRPITEWDLLTVRWAVLRDRVAHAWREHRRAEEVVEKLSEKPNVNEETWKRAMNKENRLFAEWRRLQEQEWAVVDARNAAFDQINQIPPTIIGYLISDASGNYAPWPTYPTYEEACKHCEPGEAIGAVMSDDTVTFEV